MRSLGGPVPVDLVLDATVATVATGGRGGRARRARGGPVQRFRGSDVAETLSVALRGATVLRTLRTVDLRIILETSDVVLRVISDHVDARPGEPAVTGGPDDLLAPPVRVPIPTHDGHRALEVSIGRRLLEGIADALGQRRFLGPVRMDLGALARTRCALGRLGGVAVDRPGLVLDVTRTAVTAFVLEGALTRATAVPADDLRAALRSVAARHLRELVIEGTSGGRRGWVLLSVPAALDDGVRTACAALLPAGSQLDVARLPDHCA